MTHKPAIDAALAVMDAHINALNARDETQLAATLHFPHFRLSGTNMTTWDNADNYFSDFRARAGGEWSHSSFNEIQVVHASEDKVHLNAEIRRYRHDESIYCRFRSLWVITMEEGRWAAKLRSTFAPS